LRFVGGDTYHLEVPESTMIADVGNLKGRTHLRVGGKGETLKLRPSF